MTTNRIKYFFSILMATLIMCADVFGHDNPVAHFQPYTVWRSVLGNASAKMLIIQVGMGISIVRKTGK